MSRQKISNQPLQLLGHLTTEQFFNEYWQKKPLLIRNAIDDFESLISADELAGLSLEDQVQSRIIIEKDADKPWKVIYSPLEENVFAEMPETHWTLLVSDVEKHIPEFTEITDQFRFIPDWRIDDLMISYAPEGGSVGPHIDQYDVFLLQAHGQRRWQIGSKPVEDEDFIEGLEIRVLKEFFADHDWVLNPGDMLYLPPKIAHHGVALNDCLTYSVGFRANSHNELAASYADELLHNNNNQKRYNAIDFQDHPAEITGETIQQLKNILVSSLLTDSAHIEEWFGHFITDQKFELETLPDQEFTGTDEVYQFISTVEFLSRHPAIRFAFIRHGEHSDVFINAKKYTTSTVFAETICDDRHLSTATLLKTVCSDEEKNVLLECLNQGYLYQ
ncbi:MAG: cupin domain-containing protein [Gammaproteobacteria bacterium]|nr:cupin domain-containing protein [Gammaproteobacteria bacterium]